MRILYLTIVNIDIPSSVLNKMNDQIEEWSCYGHETFVASLPIFNVRNSKNLLTKKASGYFVNRHFLLKNIKGGFFNMGNKILSVKKYRDYIISISPDVIYLRELVAFPGIVSLLNNYKVVLESNTVLMDELKANSKILFVMAKLFQEKLNKRIDGFIGVTHEVTNQFKKYHKPSITLTNGIKFEKIAIIPPVNNRAQVIMVCSPGAAWHGFDKFIVMAKLLPEMDFHLIGPHKQDFDIVLKNLVFHGYLSKDELLQLYPKMDIGVGTLALHRKNMEEACPLKVREYATFGLPMILAYQDTDFSNKNFDFVLQIGNFEKNVKKNISEIGEFINKWKGRRAPVEKLEPLISLRHKEGIRLNFFKEIIGNETTQTR